MNTNGEYQINKQQQWKVYRVESDVTFSYHVKKYNISFPMLSYFGENKQSGQAFFTNFLLEVI